MNNVNPTGRQLTDNEYFDALRDMECPSDGDPRIATDNPDVGDLVPQEQSEHLDAVNAYVKAALAEVAIKPPLDDGKTENERQQVRAG